MPMPVLQALGIDTDTSALDINGTKEALSRSYRILTDLWPLILKKRGTRQLQAFLYRNDERMQVICKFSKYDIQVNFFRRELHRPDSGGFIIELSEDEFLLVVARYGVQFLPKIGRNVTIGMETLQEESWKDGQWHAGRVLSGDERMMPGMTDLPAVRYIRLFESYWHIGEDGTLTVRFEVPFGCTAEAVLPGGETIELESGVFEKTWTPEKDYRLKYSMESRLDEVREDPEAIAVLKEDLPQAIGLIESGDVESFGSKGLYDVKNCSIIISSCPRRCFNV